MEKDIVLKKNDILVSNDEIFTINHSFKINKYKTVIFKEPTTSPTRTEGFILTTGSIIILIGLSSIIWCVFTFFYRYTSLFNGINKIIIETLKSLGIYQITLNTHIIFIVSLLVNGFLLLLFGIKISKIYFDRNIDLLLIDENNNNILLYRTEDKNDAIEITEVINNQIGLLKNNINST